MRFSSTFAIAITLALGSASKINMSCQFAQDKTGMVQSPYCCRDLTPARGNPKANTAKDCVLLKTPQLCEDQSRPACCYDIGPEKICTSHAIFQNAADV
ncbi:hypothetical protein N7454_009311 [Penicillium verhagenii]|uniref:uncharacterized protein n=1 Tax=Penicillium verhagenii TaxID=1562060 RepID=UPI002545AF90|nr:uncharacterized protein N7466_001126 [Penicillium verhagenii]KAJ5919476.1 hypothetical protein N7454_009311 [Penicillium verhagenii]KAJ5948111.1 hypothetical protein N7466_001126 [Penicillium verhagenii]